MILSEEFNAPRPYAVDPTVSHVTDGREAVFIVKENCGYSCAHPLQGRLMLARLKYFAIGLMHGDADATPAHCAPTMWISDWGELFALRFLDREPHGLHSQG